MDEIFKETLNEALAERTAYAKKIRTDAKTTGRLRLTTDLVFKSVYARDSDPDSQKALISVLNLIIDLDNDLITDIEYINPFSPTPDIGKKDSIMDIKVRTSAGVRIGIEMQVRIDDGYINRVVFYSSDLAFGALKKAQDV